MRVIVGFAFVLIIMTCFDSCFEAPHFAAKPEIEFNNLIFRKGVKTNPLITPADSLILTLNFKDGDGDLGLSGEGPDTDPPSPYVDKYYFRLDGTAVAFAAGTDLSLIINDARYPKLLSYKIKRTIPAYDTLPDLVTPYTCTNWDIIRDTSQAHNILDTIYFQFNPYHYNIPFDIKINKNVIVIGIELKINGIQILMGLSRIPDSIPICTSIWRDKIR